MQSEDDFSELRCDAGDHAGPGCSKTIRAMLCFVLMSAFITSERLHVMLQGGFRLEN